MRISKKAYTTLIITVLTLSTLAAVIPMASAIGTPTLYDSFFGWPVTSGYANAFVDVVGSGATAFGEVEVYWDTLATKIGEGYADSAGDYDIAMIQIPEDLVGIHNVIVYDVLSSDTDFATYEIIPGIFLSTSKALPGDSVFVFGSGFGDELDVSIYLGAITAVVGESVTVGGTPVTGTLANTPVVIVSAALTVNVDITGEVNGVPVTGSGSVAVTDDGEGSLEGSTADIVVDDGVVVESGEVDVTITGSINYNTGVITLVATGVDSAGGTGTVTDIVVTITTPVTADYDYAEYEITPAAGVTTSDLGSFMATVIVPAIAEVDYGDYDVTALDTDGNQNVPYWLWPPVLTVDYYITLTPATGPTGITTTIEGRIKADTDYELRFNGVPIATGTSGSDGSFEYDYVIPAILSTGTYPVDVVWQVTDSRTADFEVTDPPQVVYAPTSGVAGTVVTISTVAGFPFSADAEISLYLGTTLVNSTEMDDRFGPTGASGPSAGHFTNLEFTVPVLTPGPYALKVVDEFGASTAAIYTFTVLPTPETTAAINAASYYPGDTISFTFVSTDTITALPVCTIRDPAGSIWWQDTWSITVTGPITTVQYQWQLFGVDEHATLPADCPLGTWNWTITYTPGSTGVSTKATGLFDVIAKPSMQTVLDAIDECCANMTDLLLALGANITEVKSEVATIETTVGDIDVALTALDATITSISGDVATVKTSIGTVQTSLSSLDAVLAYVADDVVTIKTSVGDVQTSLGTLDTVVGNLYGDVVTINTTLGTLTGTITDMEGSIATIQTDIGTLKLDLATVKSDVGTVKTDVEASLPVTVDMMPVWIAVVLSLIAAIAAIFAVITIRQKIAG